MKFKKSLIVNLGERSDRYSDGALNIHYTGEPIITISLAEFSNQEKVNEVSEVLTSWVMTEYENIRIRNIGFTKFYSWKTNQKPVFDCVNKAFTNKENRKVYIESMDFLDSALVELLIFNNDKHLKKGVAKINSILKSKGIELFQLNNMKIEEFKDKINRV